MSDRLWLVILIATTVTVRVGLSLVSCDIIDVQNYIRVANIVYEQGIFALYEQTTGIYPYPPLWVWFEILTRVLSEASGLSFGFLIRCFIILADTGIVYLVWLWHRNRTPVERILWSMAYVLNPVSLIVTCLHGQFDSIPIFFSLLAIYGLEQMGRPYFSAASLSLGIAFKLYPVLLIPPMLFKIRSFSQRLAFSFVAVLPVILLILPFMMRIPDAVLRELFMYKGAALLGMLVPVRLIYVPLAHEHFPVMLTREIISASRWLFLSGYAGIAVWQMRQRQFSLVANCTLIFLWFYVAYAGIAPQYLVWVLPLLLVLDAHSHFIALAYTLTATLALYGFYVYAVPETFCFLPPTPAWLTRVLYGLLGTLWWFVSAILSIWIVKQDARKTGL